MAIRTHTGALSAVLAFSAMLCSCNTTAAVAKFCSSANTSLSSGNVIFDDIQASCLRSAATFAPITSFLPNPLVKETNAVAGSQVASCNYSTQIEGLKATTKILADYFVAMNSLASFGTAKLADDTGALAQKATTTAKLSSSGVGAAQALATLITNLVASGYQRKHLDKDIRAADPSVKTVSVALKEIIVSNYLPLLDTEQSDLAQRYQVLIRDNPCPSMSDHPATTVNNHGCNLDALIMLQDRWRQDLDILEAKRKTARDFTAALDTIASGHAALAANANHLKAKELPALLSPFSDELQNLATAMAKL